MLRDLEKMLEDNNYTPEWLKGLCWMVVGMIAMEVIIIVSL